MASSNGPAVLNCASLENGRAFHSVGSVKPERVVHNQLPIIVIHCVLDPSGVQTLGADIMHERQAT